MSSSLTNMTTAVLNLVGRPATDALITSAAITQALNDAANMFSTEYPWQWLQVSENISTTTGVDTYAVGTPAQYIDTVSVRIVGGPPLVQMSKAELDRQYPPSAAGTPLFYATHLIGSIVVRPTPITTVLPTLVHVYHRAETAVASGSDVFLCPVWYEQAILWRAAAEMLFRAGDTQRGNVFLARYDDVRDRTLEQVRRRQSMQAASLLPAQDLPPLPGKPDAARSNA